MGGGGDGWWESAVKHGLTGQLQPATQQPLSDLVTRFAARQGLPKGYFPPGTGTGNGQEMKAKIA